MTAQRFGGEWTKEKLEILRGYLDAYTTALKNTNFRLTYVDAFAGSGAYGFSSGDYEEFGELHEGSTQIALSIQDRAFDRLVFIENDRNAVRSLSALQNEYSRRRINILQGDANQQIPKFCNDMVWDDRAVVFLDPYATEVSWSTVQTIAATKKIDCWILFPLMAITRMMPRGQMPNEQTARRLDRVFGGRAYWMGIYHRPPQLFQEPDLQVTKREPVEQIAHAYKERLQGAFHRVAPTSRTLKNSRNTPLFELFFAAGNPRGAPIAIDIADHLLRRW